MSTVGPHTVQAAGLRRLAIPYPELPRPRTLAAVTVRAQKFYESANETVCHPRPAEKPTEAVDT